MTSKLRSALVAMALVAAPWDAHAQTESSDEPPSAYTVILEQALEESAASRWLEARALFRQAQAVYPNARALRAIGMASFELRDYVAAYAELGAALTEPRRPLTAAQTDDVRGLLARIRPLVGVYTLDAMAQDAVLIVDGIETPVPANRRLVFSPGRHSVEVRIGTARRRGEWTVQGGEEESLALPSIGGAASDATTNLQETSRAPAPTDAPAPVRTPIVTEAPERSRTPALAIASYAVGGGALVAGVTFLALGRRDEARVQDASVGTPWSGLERYYDRGAARERLGAGLVAASALLGGAGVVIHVLRPRADTSGLRVAVLPNGIRTEVRW